MKAIRANSLDGVEALKLEDIPEPNPGPGEVRVAVHAAGVNFADTLVVAGRYQHKQPVPFTPGMELAGEVIEAGAGVTGVKPGDRIFAAMRAGAFAEECVVPERDVMPMPDNMSYTDGAAFPIAYGTSHLGLTYRGQLSKGESILVLGAAGGIGLTAVEIAHEIGATVVAAAGGAEKLEICRKAGADHLIDYRTESIRDRVKELLGGVDCVYDPVGGDAAREALRSLNYEGRHIILGFAGGEIQDIKANYLLVKNISAVGFSWSTYRFERPELVRESFGELSRWYASGRLHPQISYTFPLAETVEAMRTLLARKSTGKVVIQVRP